ncbi:MAG: PEP-CTERM sorting domain-containing protein [Thermoguttaceae bacterium]|jgi:T5SS/PEP-CTERM-associated repeat protein
MFRRRAMVLGVHIRWLLPVLVLVVIDPLIPNMVRAAITTSGSVGPGDPATWDDSTTNAYVGADAPGSLRIDGGTGIVSYFAYIGLDPGGIGTATVAGSGSMWNSSCYFYIGDYGGTGTLNISSGGNVTSLFSVIGFSSATTGVTTGVATVAGTASTWTTTYDLDVGMEAGGNGTLNIIDGATVSSYTGLIGEMSGATGVAKVSGTGSVWNVGQLYVGSDGGSGMLSIIGGGTVTARSGSVNGTSLLAIDVDRGSTLSMSGSTITDNGTIRILAGASVPANHTYSPIVAGSWSGTGTYQAVGGTWNTTSHRFTASSVTKGTSGTPVALELATVQRAIVDDNGPGGTNWEVGASFVAATSTTNVTFTATAMNSAILDVLKADLPANESILSGWAYATTNYSVSATNPIYFSFNVGAGHPADELDLWHYDGSTWTKYVPDDLTYDGTFASFTATGLSGYAMTAVPEPGTLALLAAGLFGLLAYAWRRRHL